MSFILQRSEADHHHKRIIFLRGLRLNGWLMMVGLGVDARTFNYAKMCVDVQNHLINGVPEVEGTDALDRLLKGVEADGCDVFTGTAPGLNTKFVAAMVLALRCALGRLPNTDESRVVAAREYRRICRARNVRLTLVESSRALVLDRFMAEECFDEYVRCPRRLPRWLRFFVSFYESKEPTNGW